MLLPGPRNYIRMLHSDRADQLLLCVSFDRTQASSTGRKFDQQEDFPSRKLCVAIVDVDKISIHFLLVFILGFSFYELVTDYDRRRSRTATTVFY